MCQSVLIHSGCWSYSTPTLPGRSGKSDRGAFAQNFASYMMNKICVFFLFICFSSFVVVVAAAVRFLFVFWVFCVCVCWGGGGGRWSVVCFVCVSCFLFLSFFLPTVSAAHVTCLRACVGAENVLRRKAHSVT